MNIDLLKTELIRDEGLRLTAYRDTLGYLTIGVGRNLDANPLTTTEIEVVKHDARTKPISRGASAYLLDADVARTMSALDRALPWWRTLDEVRRRALVNMCFNLGVQKLIGFKETLGWLKQGHYTAAAECMLDSKWSAQVGNRATRLAHMIRTGRTIDQGA